MPVLNEAKYLRTTLSRLPISSNEELIIVDGGSSDNTMTIARELTEYVFQTKTGRASVMNYGAKKATGEILLFLHADCQLAETAFHSIRSILADSSIAAGAFHLSIDAPGVGFRLIEWVANTRSRLTSLMYGDQAMFLRKEVFDRIGGFAEIPLMEDIEISKRLMKQGRITFVQTPVKASPRRWHQEGMLYTTVRDWYIASLYSFFSVPPDKLIKHYKDVR